MESLISQNNEVEGERRTGNHFILFLGFEPPDKEPMSSCDEGKYPVSVIRLGYGCSLVALRSWGRFHPSCFLSMLKLGQVERTFLGGGGDRIEVNEI